MKKITVIFLILLLFLFVTACSQNKSRTDVLTTTAPLYEFTSMLCNGTDLTVDCLVSESISCLHDYTLQTQQMRAIEGAQLVVISGAGLEESFSDILSEAKSMIDASSGIHLLCAETTDEHHEHSHDHQLHGDPHIWLSPDNAIVMVENIYKGLCDTYPQHHALFDANRVDLIAKLEALSSYAQEQLDGVNSKELITFHDGFAYLADAFDLKILHAIEEESGREASAAELIHLCQLVEENGVDCIFTEINGSVTAAQIIAAETETEIRQLDMAMSGNGYFNAMYHNIDCLREALG